MSSAARHPPGLLLCRGGADVAARWAAGGLTAVSIVPAGGPWTAVVPRTAASAVPRPYDDAMSTLLNRPLPRRLRPAIGVASVRGHAMVAVTPARWRSVRRWLAWQPGVGLVHPGGLAPARLADLVRVAGLVEPSALAAVADVVHDPTGDVHRMLVDLLTVLGLPGVELLQGRTAPLDRPGSRSVEPSPERVARFERMVHEELSWREETQGRQP